MIRTFSRLSKEKLKDFKDGTSCIEITQSYSTLEVKFLDKFETMQAINEDFEQFCKRRAIDILKCSKFKKLKVDAEFYEELTSVSQNLIRHLIFIGHPNSWGEAVVLGDNIVVNANLQEW